LCKFQPENAPKAFGGRDPLGELIDPSASLRGAVGSRDKGKGKDRREEKAVEGARGRRGTEREGRERRGKEKSHPQSFLKVGAYDI